MSSAAPGVRLCFATVSLLAAIATSYSQAKDVSKDQCVISYLANSTGKLKLEIERGKKPEELGKIDISDVTEGTAITKTYRIPNTQLRVLVDLLFDDDLSRDLGKGDRIPTDAMTLWLTVWNGPKRNPTTVLAMAINQSALNSIFFRSVTSTYARRGSKLYFVLADCTANSGQENDKL